MPTRTLPSTPAERVRRYRQRQHEGNLVTFIASSELPVGVELTVSGERLRWRAPRGVVTADVWLRLGRI